MLLAIEGRSIFGFFCFTGVSSILARFESAKSVLPPLD